MTPAIQLSYVSKWYPRLESSLHRTVSHWLGGKEIQGVWALRDVSLSVMPGEGVGLIGRNGSGKTTLLRLIAGITRPTTGSVRADGTVRSLIGMGEGLHPELSGAENILLLGTLLGMRRREVAQRFDDILGFAELREFKDLPLKRYSAGMRARLSFSVATHTEPEVLLVDESLAIGDAAFQDKSLAMLRNLRHRGVTVVAASHDGRLLSALCDRVLWLDAGRARGMGNPDALFAEYVGTTTA